MILKLEAGEFYLNASGEIINIVNIRIKDLTRTFYDSNSNSYSQYGKFYPDDKIESSIDLIAHIPKELHYRICDMVNNYHTDKKAKFHIDNQYKERNDN